MQGIHGYKLSDILREVLAITIKEDFKTVLCKIKIIYHVTNIQI